MDAGYSYQVIFSGRLRHGFEVAQVKQALGEKLKLPEKKIELLFSGKPLVLKRTNSAEEAKKLAALLASIGAIASIRTDNAAKQAENKRVAEAAKIAAPSTELDRFSPYPKGGRLTAALILAAASEIFFTLLYLFLLFFFSIGLLYYSVFTTWGASLIGFAPLALFFQIIVLVLGLVVLFLLAKPFRSFNPHHRKGISVSEEQEPDLHAFVEDVAEKIGTPVPSEIRITNNTEVELSYLKGPVGFLLNRHVLTIGAPLAAACDTSQLAAVIAQSLQMFHSKKLSPRAAYLLRGSDGWLQRAIYGQDAIDRWLEEQVRERSVISAAIPPLQKIIAVSRQILGLRLRLSRYLTRPLIQRLVADADKVSLVFTGSKGFVGLMEKQRLLAFTSQGLLPGLQESWQTRGELPDNLIQLMVRKCKQQPPTIHQELRTSQEQQKALSRDTIPADSQRLRRVSKTSVDAAYPCHSPAATLFRNFSKLARTMTLRLYHNRLKIPVSSDRLTAVTAPDKQTQQQQLHIDHVFRKLYADFIPLKIRHGLDMTDGYENALERREAALAEMEKSRSHAELAFKRYRENEQALIDIHIQEIIHRAGLWKQWGLERENRAGLELIHSACREQESGLEENTGLVSRQLHPYVQRLTASLALLNTPQAAKISGAATLYKETTELAKVLERIEQSSQQLHNLRLHTILLQTLLSFNDGEKSKQHECIQEQARVVQTLITGLGANLKTTPYPFSKGPSHENLMAYALHNAYPEQTAEGDFDRGNDVVNQIIKIQRHILARLCAIALHTEKALGLKG